MPKYKFRWSNLPCKLVDELREALIEGDGESVELLDELYGTRPKDDFVREAWPVLLEIPGWNTTRSRDTRLS